MLLAVPLVVLGAPMLLIGFFAANNFAGAILGPPAIWERPKNSVSRQDVVGEYVEISRNTTDQVPSKKATLALRADGTMVVEGLPYEFYPDTCTITGTGTWNGPDDNELKIDLSLTSDGSSGVCPPGGINFWSRPDVPSHTGSIGWLAIRIPGPESDSR
jgi:hypothetical protein